MTTPMQALLTPTVEFKKILALELPFRADLSPRSHIRWLRRSYTQEELRTFVLRAFNVLFTLDHDTPEWDVLTEATDAMWDALDVKIYPR